MKLLNWSIGLSVDFLFWIKEKRQITRLKNQYGLAQWLVQWRLTITCFAPLEMPRHDSF